LALALKRYLDECLRLELDKLGTRSYPFGYGNVCKRFLI